MNDEVEINLADIVQFVKQNIKRIILWAVVFGIIGTIYAFFIAPKEYESKAQLLPEVTSGAGGASGALALASMAGIDLGSAGGGGTDAIRADIYPTLVQSPSFALYILQQKVNVKELNKTMTLEEFFDVQSKSWFGDDTKVKEEGKIAAEFKDQVMQLTLKQAALIKNIKSRIVVTYDRKTSIIAVNTKMPDPYVAAQTARYTAEYLKEYIIDYRTDKARKQKDFLEKQVREAERRYKGSQNTVAGYLDRNQGLIFNTAKIAEQRLQADFMLAQSVYNDLVRQYERAKIKLQEETPVFKLIDNPEIPINKSEPKRLIIMMVSGFLGAIVGLLISLWPKAKTMMGL
jgi:uncharacterized protein involved in exopolysaccharide biosynthesis